MLGWLKDRYNTFSAVAGPRKYIISLLVAAIVAGIDRIEELARWAMSKWLALTPPAPEPTMIFGFPSWIVGIAVLFALLWWWTLEYAVRLRRQLKPKFSVSYDDTSLSFRKPIILKYNDKARTNGISIRLKIECVSGVDIEQCSGHLTKIEFRITGGAFSEIPIYEPNRLSWALERDEFAPVSVFSGVPKYLGICLAREDTNNFQFRTNVRSFVAPYEFDSIGEYKFYVSVVARHCSPVSAVTCVQWNGQWNEIKAWLAVNT